MYAKATQHNSRQDGIGAERDGKQILKDRAQTSVWMERRKGVYKSPGERTFVSTWGGGTIADPYGQK